MANMARHGFDHILTKPFRIPELMEIISRSAKAA
jgi:CheY-like chemotaxis protein